MSDDRAAVDMPQHRAAGERGHAIAQALSSREWDRLTDAVLARIERHVADELDRRGQRATPRVY